MQKIRFSRRAQLSVLLVLALILSFISVLPVSADDISVRTEPMYITTDDYISCIAGTFVYCDPKDHSTSLLVDICPVKSRTADGLTVGNSLITGSDDPDLAWIDIQKAENPDIAPCTYIVSFRYPEGEYTEIPEFLAEAELNDGHSIVVLDPAYCISAVIGLDGEGDAFAETTDPVYAAYDSDCFDLLLERPQSFASSYTQELAEVMHDPKDKNAEKEYKVLTDGEFRTYFYYPESIRTLNEAISQNPAHYSSYGITPGDLMIQYDIIAGDTDVSEVVDELPAKIWEGGILVPAESEDGVLSSGAFDFTSETVRALFSEELLVSSTEEAEEGDETTEPLPTHWAVLPDTTFRVRARFVLPFTDEGGNTRYAVSSFTDYFRCGAETDPLSLPESLDAPCLVPGEFELLEDGSVILHFSLSPTDKIREAGVYQMFTGSEPLKCDANISVNGSEWTPVAYSADNRGSIFSNGDYTVTVPADQMTEYAYIRLRTQYKYGSGDTALESQWSVSAAYENKPDDIVTEPVDTAETEENTTEAPVTPPKKKSECTLCGICSAPYGICLFLWIAAVILIALFIGLVIAIIPRKKTCPRCEKKCKPNEAVCPGCGYRFVGSMPEIEDEEENIPTPIVPPVEPETSAEEDSPAIKLPVISDVTETPVETPAAEPEKEAHEVVLPTVTPEFLSALRTKMKEAKAGGHPLFTKEEIAYIKALKEKAKKPADPPVQLPPKTEEPVQEQNAPKPLKFPVYDEIPLEKTSDPFHLDKKEPDPEPEPVREEKKPVSVEDAATTEFTRIFSGSGKPEEKKEPVKNPMSELEAALREIK